MNDIKKLKKIVTSNEDYTSKRRKLCDLEIENTIHRIQNVKNEKELQYLKRKLRRLKRKWKELWR